MYRQRVEEAIEAIKQGQMIIIMDDEDRENEGDLVMAGIFSSPEKINFMAQEARGLICVSITQELAQKLELPPMVQKNDSNHETAFTISIDARDAKTGISAYERDMTIHLMCQSNAKPSHFVRPGHIFPLIAKEGGVLVRTGHTEASVDICRLAGVAPIGVICEIMKKDGTMAGRGDKFLLDFAREHHLKILYVSDIIQYRLNSEDLLQEQSRMDAEFMGIACEKIRFIDHLEREHIVFGFGMESQVQNDEQDAGKGDSQDRLGQGPALPLIRFHSVSSDVEVLQSPQEWRVLCRSVEYLSQKGGYLVCLNGAKYEEAMSADVPKSCGEMKDFGVGAQILRRLGIKDFVLLSASGANQYHALSGFDLHLVETIEV